MFNIWIYPYKVTFLCLCLPMLDCLDAPDRHGLPKNSFPCPLTKTFTPSPHLITSQAQCVFENHFVSQVKLVLLRSVVVCRFVPFLILILQRNVGFRKLLHNTLSSLKKFSV